MPLDLLTTEFLVASGAAVAAGLMRGFAGFGSAMVTAPVFAILFGPVETVAIIILMEIVVTVQLMPGILGDVEWRFVGPMAAAAALFMPLGSWLLVTMDPGIMARAMAAIVVAFAVVLMTGWRYRGGRRPLPTMVVGAVSGVMVAATTLGIPPVMLYMLSGRDTAARNRANVIGFFAITLTVLIALMSATGMMSWDAVWRAAMLMPGFMLTTWIGGRLFRQSSEHLYRRVALVFLLGVGVFGLLR
ncbi:MAG: sulfite exporter TauE/SafE family protein [Proteobacteria bacterium]|nr:sulfite exporter TauE/SafE family protein [Pseudomonadota bacterium]